MKPLKRVDYEPDSLAKPSYAIRVDDTEPVDHPEFGSVEIRIWHNGRQSTTLHLSRQDAEILAGQLEAYLARKNRTHVA